MRVAFQLTVACRLKASYPPKGAGVSRVLSPPMVGKVGCWRRGVNDWERPTVVARQMSDSSTASGPQRAATCCGHVIRRRVIRHLLGLPDRHDQTVRRPTKDRSAQYRK